MATSAQVSSQLTLASPGFQALELSLSWRQTGLFRPIPDLAQGDLIQDYDASFSIESSFYFCLHVHVPDLLL